MDMMLLLGLSERKAAVDLESKVHRQYRNSSRGLFREMSERLLFGLKLGSEVKL